MPTEEGAFQHHHHHHHQPVVCCRMKPHPGDIQLVFSCSFWMCTLCFPGFVLPPPSCVPAPVSDHVPSLQPICSLCGLPFAGPVYRAASLSFFFFHLCSDVFHTSLLIHGTRFQPKYYTCQLSVDCSLGGLQSSIFCLLSQPRKELSLVLCYFFMIDATYTCRVVTKQPTS